MKKEKSDLILSYIKKKYYEYEHRKEMKKE